MFYVAYTQKQKLGVATYANSITLTPGTVTVDIDDDGFLVHALTGDFGDDVRSGDMDKRVDCSRRWGAQHDVDRCHLISLGVL